MADILLVDDNDDDVALALAALRGCVPAPSVAIANDADEAEAALAAAIPRVVFLDLKLEGVDGFELLRRIRAAASTTHLPVVVLTSSDEKADVNRAYGLGANSYLRKQVDFEAFTRAMRSAVEYWVSLNIPAAHDAEYKARL